METAKQGSVTISLGLYQRLMEKQSEVRGLEQQLTDSKRAAENVKYEIEKQRQIVENRKAALVSKKEVQEERLKGINQRINRALARIPQERASINRLQDVFAELSDKKKTIVAIHAAQSSAVMQMDRYKEYVSTLSRCFPDLPPPHVTIKRLSRLYTVDTDLSCVRLRLVDDLKKLREAQLVKGQVTKMAALRASNLQQKSSTVPDRACPHAETEDQLANEENAKLGRLTMAVDALAHLISTNPVCTQLLSCKTGPQGVHATTHVGNTSGTKSPSVEKWRRAVQNLKSKANSPCPSSVHKDSRRSPSPSRSSKLRFVQTSLEKLQLIQEAAADLRLVVEELQRGTRAPGSCQPDYTRITEN